MNKQLLVGFSLKCIAAINSNPIYSIFYMDTHSSLNLDIEIQFIHKAVW